MLMVGSADGRGRALRMLGDGGKRRATELLETFLTVWNLPGHSYSSYKQLLKKWWIFFRDEFPILSGIPPPAPLIRPPPPADPAAAWRSSRESREAMRWWKWSYIVPGSSPWSLVTRGTPLSRLPRLAPPPKELPRFRLTSHRIAILTNLNRSAGPPERF